MDRAKKRSGEDTLDEPLKDADIVRDALRHWARESPYAMDAGEMALLLASRAMRAKGASLWKGAMRSFGGLTGDAELEARINAFVETVPEAESRSEPKRDRGEVQASRKRKAS